MKILWFMNWASTCSLSVYLFVYNGQNFIFLFLWPATYGCLLPCFMLEILLLISNIISIVQTLSAMILRHLVSFAKLKICISKNYIVKIAQLQTKKCQISICRNGVFLLALLFMYHYYIGMPLAFRGTVKPPWKLA